MSDDDRRSEIIRQARLLAVANVGLLIRYGCELGLHDEVKQVRAAVDALASAAARIPPERTETPAFAPPAYTRHGRAVNAPNGALNAKKDKP